MDVLKLLAPCPLCGAPAYILEKGHEFDGNEHHEIRCSACPIVMKGPTGTPGVSDNRADLLTRMALLVAQWNLRRSDASDNPTKPEMHVMPDENYIHEALTILNHEIKTCALSCPRCKTHVETPIAVYERDIKRFKELLDSAYAVMDRHGISALLLSEIYAECVLRIALNKVKSTD